MRHRLPSLATALMALTVALAASADGYDVVGKPNIAFTASGTGGFSFTGTIEQLTTIDQGETLIFKASLKDLKTGLGLRDKHTKEHLDVEHWPDASLSVDKSAIKFPDDGKKSSGTAPGKFRLHGVTHDVKVTYAAERHGSDYAVEGHFIANTTDYKIEKACFPPVGGICVDPNVKVDVKFKLHAK